MRHGAVIFTLVVVIGSMIGRWSPDEVRPGYREPVPAAIGGRKPVPSALDESGITTENTTPAPTKQALPDRRPVVKSRAPARSHRLRPAADSPVELPSHTRTGSLGSRGSVETHLTESGSWSRAHTQPPDPGAASPSAAVAGGSDAQPGQQVPSQVPALDSAPPAPAAAPQISPPVTAVLTPPVPVDITPPTHPLPYRMVVDAPGLSSTARLESVEARVRLRLVVRTDGSVAGVEVAIPSGRRELDAAALDAARHWRFLPARRDGRPIDSVALIWVAFVVGP